MRSFAFVVVLFAACSSESTYTVDLIEPFEVRGLAPGALQEVMVPSSSGKTTLTVQVNNKDLGVRAFCSITGCGREDEFSVSAGGSGRQSADCPANTSLQVRCHGLARVAFSIKGPPAMDAGVDAGPPCRISGLTLEGATQLSAGEYEFRPVPFDPADAGFVSGLLNVQTDRGAGECSIGVELSNPRYFFSRTLSATNHTLLFRATDAGLDERTTVTVTSPSNTYSLQLRARTWTRCPDADAGNCPGVPVGERWGTDGVAMHRIDDTGAIAQRVTLVSNEFQPLSSVRDLAFDSLGRAWVLWSNLVCEADPVSGVVRNCWDAGLGELRGLGGFGDGGLIASARSVYAIDPITHETQLLLDAGTVFVPGDLAADSRGVFIATRGLVNDELRVLRSDGGLDVVPLSFTGVQSVMADGARLSVLTDRGFIVDLTESGQIVGQASTVVDWVGGASRAP